MNKLYLILSLLLMSAALSSCNFIHADDYDLCDEPLPPQEENLPILVNLIFDTDLPLHKEVTYTRAGEDYDPLSVTYDNSYLVRYNVQIFSGVRSRSDIPIKTLQFTNRDLQNLDYSFSLTLPDGNYEFYVFSDLIDNADFSDKFYTTSDFTYISVLNAGGHPGNREERDCFRGIQTQYVENSPQRTDYNTIDIPMLRPVARFEFIATDYDEFVDSEVKRSLKNQTKAEINPDDYQVMIQYDGFMPNAYDAYSDYPTDANRNTVFNSSIQAKEDGTASLGFDYVFVYPGESSLNLILNVKDKQGNLISATSSIEVPLYRSKNTVIKGEFLTSKGSGGVGIVPDFDGEYNVEFH